MDTIKVFALSRYESVKDSAGKVMVKELIAGKPDNCIELSKEVSLAVSTLALGKIDLKEMGTFLTLLSGYFGVVRKAHSYRLDVTPEKGTVRSSVVGKEIIQSLLKIKSVLYTDLFATTPAVTPAEESAE